MVIEALFDIVYNIFDRLTANINIPNIPPEAEEYINSAIQYISSGAGFLSQFFDLNYLFTLFSLVLIVESGIWIYDFVLWILKKIPALGVE